jgi:hypothetical protein
MTKTEYTAALESALEATATTGHGAWSVSCEGYVQLVWTCDEDALPEMYGDEPWSEFGGNAIIAASGLPEFDDSGCDSYRDVVVQWVQWNV